MMIGKTLGNNGRGREYVPYTLLLYTPYMVVLACMLFLPEYK